MLRFRLQGEPCEYYPWISATPLGFRSEGGIACIIYTARTSSTEQPLQPPGTVEVRVPSHAPFGLVCATQRLAQKVTDFSRFWRRVRQAAKRPVVLSPAEELPEASGRSELQQLYVLCQHTQDFNRDILAAGQKPKLPQELNRARDEGGQLWPAGSVQYYGWQRLSAAYEAADYLAGIHQPWHDRLQALAFVVLFVGAIFFGLYAHWPSDFPHTNVHAQKVGEPGQSNAKQITEVVHRHDPLWLHLFLATLVASMFLVSWVWFRRLDEKQLDYRTLAEALRVRKYWARAGLSASVVESYLGQRRGETTWARRAVYNICPPPAFWAAHFATLSQADQLSRLEAILNEWAIGQRDWFKKSHQRHGRSAGLRVIGFVVALLGWLALAALVLTTGGEHPDSWLIAPLLAVFGGGLFVAYCERRSYDELAQQYERMHAVFANGAREARRWLDAKNVQATQNVFEALGREALTENATWLILRRARPLELPIGG
jgi:hypothetical protein